MKRSVLAWCGLCTALSGGCLERMVRVTSEPAGALVTINGVEAGRTPLETSFVHYGVYDVQVRREGFAAASGPAVFRAPVWEVPPVDFLATVTPVRLRTQRELRYVLVETPAWSEAERAAVLERARELQARANLSVAK